MGRHSLSLWPRWLAELPVPVFYRDDGTLLLWHREDAGEAVRVRKDCSPRAHAQASSGCVEQLGNSVNWNRHSEQDFPQALYIFRAKRRSTIGNSLKAVALALEEAGVECHWETFVSDGTHSPTAGIVVDCRGMGAKRDWSQLRGVRGEIVRLKRPRSNCITCCGFCTRVTPYTSFLVRREDWLSGPPASRVTIALRFQSVELWSYSRLHIRYSRPWPKRAFSNSTRRCDPPCPTTCLRFSSIVRGRSCYINGLYRHGFLLTPTIVEEVLALLSAERFADVQRWPCFDEDGYMYRICSSLR